jgi:hypothetical protein
LDNESGSGRAGCSRQLLKGVSDLSTRRLNLRQRPNVMSRTAWARARRAAMSLSGLGQSNVENLLLVPGVLSPAWVSIFAS